MQLSIHNLIREAETNYVDNPVEISEYVSFDMHDTIETIDAYLNSKHKSGETDSLGREKPFFDIVTAATNIWYRATDIDRKDIKILPSSIDTTSSAYIATIILQQWMRDARFGMFLNEWGRTLARYGSAVVKFVEKDGQLKSTVIPWNRLIVDPIDFEALPTIEKLYLTPSQLRSNKMYDQDVVESLLSALQSRENLDGTDKDQNNNFIEVYEVHGELAEEMLTDEEVIDENESKYRQQMHVVSYVKGDKRGEYKDFTLYRGREKKHPYKITHLIPEDGRTLAIGAVEHLFNAQWMVNHSQKNIKDTLDLASKLIFQTSDPRYVGRNVLSAIETGDILIHDQNQPLTQVNNNKADISAFQNFALSWQNIASEITSTPDAIKGNTLPSGTPYSLGAFLGGQANSLFEIMTENKGLYIEEMMREYILPHVKTKMNTKDEIMAILDSQGIAEIDAMYVPRQAKKVYNQRMKDAILNVEEPLPEGFDANTEEATVKRELSEFGNKRFFAPDEIEEKTWNEALNDFEMTCIVEVTNENTDKQAVLTTLSTVLQTIGSNPAILQDPNARMVFNQILTETGKISPIQLSSASASPPATMGGTEALPNLTQQNNEQPISA